MEALEKVQKSSARLLPALRHLNYLDRLKARKLTTLHYRQIRRDRYTYIGQSQESINNEITQSMLNIYI